MNSIQQIVADAIGEIEKEIKTIGMSNVGKTVKQLGRISNKMILDIVKNVIEMMDTSLVEKAKSQRHKDGITIKERNVERVITTDLGDLHYRRTYFKLSDGQFSYILDHLIGVESYERFSKELIASVLNDSATESYQKAILSSGCEMSRQTVHNRLLAMDDLAMPVERVESTPETLDLFADEDHVHLNPKSSAIVPLVTITEGINADNPKRHETIHPFHIAAYGMQPDAFRENVLAVMTERYDFSKIKKINIHADGGAWIQGLQQVIPFSKIVMDGYHLEKEIRSFLRLEGAASFCTEIRRAIINDKRDDFEKCCSTIYSQQTTPDGQSKAQSFMKYCLSHWDAIVLRLQNKTCGSCTESMVSHVLSDRLSRHPIAWSKNGLHKMTMIVTYTKNGGKICGENVRIHPVRGIDDDFVHNGYSVYREYANQQVNDMLKSKHDWSIFEHESFSESKVNGIYLIRKSLGSIPSISDLAL